MSFRDCKIFINFKIPFEDIFQRSQKSLKWMSVQNNNTAISFCNNISSSRFILEKSSFSKVLSYWILLYLFCWTGSFFNCGNSFSIWHNIKDIPFISLFYNVISIIEMLFFKGLCQFLSLVIFHCLQKRYLFQKCFIFFFLFHCCIFHNMIKCLSVQGPQCWCCICNYGSCSGCIIKKSQFSKSLSWLVSLKEGWFSLLRK